MMVVVVKVPQKNTIKASQIIIIADRAMNHMIEYTNNEINTNTHTVFVNCSSTQDVHVYMFAYAHPQQMGTCVGALG